MKMHLKIVALAALAKISVDADPVNNGSISTSFEEMIANNAAKYEFLKDHSCNCPGVFGEFALGGTYTETDAMETACHQYRRCMTCTKDDTDCAAEEVDNVSFSWGIEAGEATCQTNVGCAARKCECHTKFFNAINKAIDAVAGTPTATAGDDLHCVYKPGKKDKCCFFNNTSEYILYNQKEETCSEFGLSKKCAADTIPNADYSGCDACPAGQNSLAGQTTCTECTNGTAWNPATGICSAGLNDILNGAHSWEKNSLGFYVHISNTKMTWNQAKTYCNGLGTGAQMAMPQNDEENKIFIDNLTAKTSDFGWWGYKRYTPSDKKTWQGSDMSAMTYSQWCSGEPNDWNQEEECAMSWKPATCWNDINCNNSYRAMCIYYD